MNIDNILDQLASLKDDRNSFLSGDKDHDQIWIDDIKALEAAMTILKALRDEGIMDAGGVKGLPRSGTRRMRGDEFVVVTGYYDNDTKSSNFIQAIGTYNDELQAYGKALLYLSELASNLADGEPNKITPLFELNCQTGYGMELRNKKTTDYVYVLFNRIEDSEEWGDDA